MPMRVLNIANTPAFEARDDGSFGGPDYDLTDFGVALVDDLNAAEAVVRQSEYRKYNADIRAEIDKIAFLQIRRERARLEARDRGET